MLVELEGLKLCAKHVVLSNEPPARPGTEFRGAPPKAPPMSRNVVAVTEAVTQHLSTLPAVDFRLDFLGRKSVHAA